MMGSEIAGTIFTLGPTHYNTSKSSGPVDIDMYNNQSHHTMDYAANSTAAPIIEGSGSVGAEGRNLVVVGILIGLIVLLCIFLAIVAVPPLYAVWRSSIPVNPKKIERRYRTIEGWLISKRIKDHDDRCDNLQCAHADNRGQEQQQGTVVVDEPPPIEECHSTDDTVDSNGSVTCCAVECACDTPKSKKDETKELDLMGMSESYEEHECPICMELFLVGQVVSWSATPTCEHVFHHSCIKEWLLRHIHCPCCREIYLLVDCPQKKKYTSADLQKLALQRKKRYDQTYFCVKEGLVSLHNLSTSPSNTGEMMALIKSKTKSGVSKTVLATMRSTPVTAGETTELNQTSTSTTNESPPEETQQPTSTSSSSASPSNTSASARLNAESSGDAPFDEILASVGNIPSSSASTLGTGIETEPTLRPLQSSVNISIAGTAAVTTTTSPRKGNFIWRGLDEANEIPSVLLPFSKSLVADDFDMEAGRVLAPESIPQTDSFKENQTTSSSPRVKQSAITLIMGATSKGYNRRNSLKTNSPVITQSFTTETCPNV